MALTRVQILKVAKKKKVAKLKEKLKASKKLESQLLKQLAKLIEQDNEKFKKLTPARARVVLAQDVLKQLKTKKITATLGRYIDVVGDKGAAELVEKAKLTAQKDVVTVKLPACNVCAIGSVFVAAFNRFDEMKIYDFQNAFGEGTKYVDDTIISYLEQWFESSQLRLMEAAFEPEEIARDMQFVEREEVSRAQQFRKEVLEKRFLQEGPYKETLANAVMVAIMKNIIKHKGTFNP